MKLDFKKKEMTGTEMAIGCLIILVVIALTYGCTVLMVGLAMWSLCKLGIIAVWTWKQAALWAIVLAVVGSFFKSGKKED
jgi:hypothetical protein